MFAERLDSLMSIAEVSNTLLGHAVNINSSHIGRLRSGTRPLPKRHEFVGPMCVYLASQITKEYQITALRRLTGIKSSALAAPADVAQYLETWLLEPTGRSNAAARHLIFGFSNVSTLPGAIDGSSEESDGEDSKFSMYLYGNSGKRKAIEQFLLKILQEDEPQTLLLYSEENIAWFVEDSAYAIRWTELFRRVLLRGNKVRIIHTVSRSVYDLMDGLIKWIPIYMTGMVESYYYPHFRDGIIQRTLYIAPKTAAVVSSSVQQDTDGMLNLFLTDRAAVEALSDEYLRYFALCRPLMSIFTSANAAAFHKTMYNYNNTPGNIFTSSSMPPLFSMPKALVEEIAEKTGSRVIVSLWNRSLTMFRDKIKTNLMTVSVLDPELMLKSGEKLVPPMAESFDADSFEYTEEQYRLHLRRLLRMARHYENFTVRIRNDIQPHTLLYVKEDVCAVMAKSDAPMSAFVMNEPHMVSAFWDYLSGQDSQE